MIGPSAALPLAGLATHSSLSQTYCRPPAKSITAFHRSRRTCVRPDSEADSDCSCVPFKVTVGGHWFSSKSRISLWLRTNSMNVGAPWSDSWNSRSVSCRIRFFRTLTCIRYQFGRPDLFALSNASRISSWDLSDMRASRERCLLTRAQHDFTGPLSVQPKWARWQLPVPDIHAHMRATNSAAVRRRHGTPIHSRKNPPYPRSGWRRHQH